MAGTLNNFYVYVLYREDGTTPFYVGKGSGSRWLTHEWGAKRGRSRKDNIVCRIQALGHSVPKKKVAEGLTREEASRLEIELIAKLGRAPHGPLVNITAGGDGCYAPTVEHREKMRLAHLGHKDSEETRIKKSLASKRNYARIHSPEAIAKRSASRKGTPVGKETREKISKALTGRKPDPEVVARRGASISAATKGKPKKPFSPERKARASAASRASWARATPEERLTRAGMLGKKHSVATKLKMREARLRVVARRVNG